MLQFTREQIYQAFFNLVAGAVYVSGPNVGQQVFKFTSRRLRSFDDLDNSQQPALMMKQDGELAQRPHNLPPIWKMDVRLFILFRSPILEDPFPPDTEVAPASTINLIVDAIEKVLEPLDKGTFVQTLATQNSNHAMVKHARIQGRIEIDEGYEDQQGMIVIPCEILPTR
jgi:hypothetical protein